MDRNKLLTLYDKELRIEIEYPDMRKEILPHVIRFTRPPPGDNRILYSWLDETNADAVIQEQIAHFSPSTQSLDWYVHEHDLPADLIDRLAAQEFEVENPGSIMVLELQETPTELLEPVQAEVCRLSLRDQLEDVIQIEEQVWGGDFSWIKSRLGEHLEIPGYLSVYVAYVEEKPACCGWTYYPPHCQFASLWGGSTIPEQRGRGLYTAVLKARVQEALRHGRRFLSVDATEMSLPIVKKHGFQFLTRASHCTWKPAG